MKDQRNKSLPIIADWIKWNQYFGVYWVDVDTTKPYKPKPIGLYSVYEDFEEFMRDMLMKQAKSSYRQGIEDAIEAVRKINCKHGIHGQDVAITHRHGIIHDTFDQVIEKLESLKNQSHE